MKKADKAGIKYKNRKIHILIDYLLNNQTKKPYGVSTGSSSS